MTGLDPGYPRTHILDPSTSEFSATVDTVRRELDSLGCVGTVVYDTQWRKDQTLFYTSIVLDGCG